VGIAALFLLAALPASIIAAGARQLPIVTCAGLIVLAAPMLGYVDFNPPLLGMALGAMIIAPLIAGWVHGADAGWRSLRALGLAFPVLVVASLYWIVEALLFLSIVPSAQLATVSSWSWTEARATIGNAFWLNTTWAWTFPEYFTFAKPYESFPLQFLKFLLPAVAFSALSLARLKPGSADFGRREKAVRIALAAATGAVIILFLSTGTNPPGNAVFDALYRLPLGWILREPGRFLMVVGLAYAVLFAVVIDELTGNPIRFLSRIGVRSRSGIYRSATVLAFAAALPLGFPLLTGSVVPDERPILPSAHVRVPPYWADMARFTDSLQTHGGVLVMPPDDFYQMPYRWGYYGTDDFIVNLFHRPVVVPNGQGYAPASSQLAGAVNLAAQSILHNDWMQMEALVRAMDTPFVLVRRDIDSGFGGRAIIRGDELEKELTAAPNFALVRTIGSLSLFVLVGSTVQLERIATPVTIDSQTPDLRLLPLLSPGTALVSSQPRYGLASVSMAPPLDAWRATSSGLTWLTSLRDGWEYRLASLDSRRIVQIDQTVGFRVTESGADVAYIDTASGKSLAISIGARTVISNGSFDSGVWGPVGDCNAARPLRQAQPSARVVRGGAPGGLPALQLSATADSACETSQLEWRGGQLALSLLVHPIRGGGPRLCIWETGPQRCASIPAIPQRPGWSTYNGSVRIGAGTTSVSLGLYADASNGPALIEYADVRVLEVPALPDFALFATPQSQSASKDQLVVDHTTFSYQWGADRGTHVLIDGMLNGWLVGSEDEVKVKYLPTNLVRVAQWLSAFPWFAVLSVMVFGWFRRIARARQRQP